MAIDFDPMAMIRALQMAPDEAQELEQRLAQDPHLLEPRIQLASYYATKPSPSDKAARVRHLLWLIENEPKHFILSSPLGFYSGGDEDNEHYQILKQAWLSQVDRYPRSISVLTNAASFFRFNDPHFAEELLLKAKAVDPSDMRVCLNLGTMYQQGSHASSAGIDIAPSLDKAIQQFEDMNDGSPEQQFCALTSLVEVAGDAGDAQRVDELAPVLLEQASNNRDSWNYGNAIFHANLALAKIEFARGNFSTSADYLVRASASPGSPQLMPAGPLQYDIAIKLLENGETSAVKTFLHNIAKFWDSQGRIEKWIAEIDDGQVPDFHRDLFDFAKFPLELP